MNRFVRSRLSVLPTITLATDTPPRLCARCKCPVYQAPAVIHPHPFRGSCDGTSQDAVAYSRRRSLDSAKVMQRLPRGGVSGGYGTTLPDLSRNSMSAAAAIGAAKLIRLLGCVTVLVLTTSVIPLASKSA